MNRKKGLSKRAMISQFGKCKDVMIHQVATEPRDTPRSVTSFELAAMIRDLGRRISSGPAVKTRTQRPDI
jgi:hypothetical protein